MMNDERALRLRHAPQATATVAVGESYYVRALSEGVAVHAAKLEHAKRHGSVGEVLHTEMVRSEPPMWEVVLSTMERVEEVSS